MTRSAFAVLGLIGAAVVGNTLSGSAPPVPRTAAAEERTHARYQCAMHPQIVSDQPGVCPICQMHLQRVDEPAAAATPAPAPGRGRPLFYRHPMRPDVTSPTPAKDEMGMDYVPVYEDVEVPGHAPFTLSTERQQLIGVTTAPVERRPLDVEIRAVGKVAYDPALYQAVVEYREALRARRKIADSPWHEARAGGDALIRGAALKLRQQGLSDAQIAALTQDDRDPVNLLLPDKSVWVYLQVYEYQVDLVRPGQAVVLTAPSAPGRTYEASVTAVDPIVSPTTHTARVRALVSTPDASLRPQSVVRGTIRVPLGEQVALPEAAVLDTGAHQIVFVVRDEGRFEPRAVRLGREAGDHFEVLGGVEPGERVVTSANFLIDSESRFRAALSAFGGGAHAGHQH